MTEAEIESLVRSELYAVAPDLEGLEIEPNETFRDQFEIDSMDTLNFIIGLSKATGLDIPEADYPKLETFAGCKSYISKRLRAPG